MWLMECVLLYAGLAEVLTQLNLLHVHCAQRLLGHPLGLVAIEVGPVVCGVLGLTWAMFFFVFSLHYEEVFKESLTLLPRVSFVFKEGL